MKNIAVFFGGESVEHEISVITGVLTANSLDKTKYNAVPVYADEKGRWFTGEYLLNPDNYKAFEYKKVKRVALVAGEKSLFTVKGKKLKKYCDISVAINCMHGERGEDGALAGTLALCGIPLASPPVLASAVSMDKIFTKYALKGLGVKALPFATAESAGEISRKKIKFGYPMIVKPACGGSSIGVRRAETEAELKSATSFALRFGSRAIIEPCLTGFTEINCAAYFAGGEIFVSECERPVGKGEILSFTDKYVKGEREFPANIDEKISEEIKKTTHKVYEKLGFRGVIRIDYFLSDGTVYLNEINAVPGSLAYYLFCVKTADFKELLTGLTENALSEAAGASTERRSFKSGILSGLGSKGSKGKE